MPQSNAETSASIAASSNGIGGGSGGSLRSSQNPTTNHFGSGSFRNNRPHSRAPTPRFPPSSERESTSISLVNLKARGGASATKDKEVSILAKFDDCKLYFWGIHQDSLQQFQELLVAYGGIRLNVDAGDTAEYTGCIEFESRNDTEKAYACLSYYKLKDGKSILYLSPLGKDLPLEDPGNLKVRVNHIPENADTSTLYDFLKSVGPVFSCYVAKDRDGRNKDYAVGQYYRPDDAENAVEQLNFSEYLGSTVSLQTFADRRTNRLRSVPSSLLTSPPVASNGSESTEAATPVTATTTTIAAASVSVTTPTTTTSAAPTSAELSIATTSHPTAAVAVEAPLPTPLRLGAETPLRTHRVSTPTPGQGLGGVIVPGKLFVTNLHPTVSHSELFQLFKPFGFIHTARVSVDEQNKKSRGHGIVQFGNPQNAIHAMNSLQGIELKGRKITIYQYEHVNKDGSGLKRPPTSLQESSAMPRPPSSAAAAKSTDLSPGSGSASRLQASTPVPPSPSVARAPSRYGDVATPGPARGLAATPVPPTPSLGRAPSRFGSESVSASHADPLLDPIMLENLSISARSEVLTQKLLSQVSTNPALDLEGAPEVIATLLKYDTNDIIHMINDPEFLEEQWVRAREHNVHSPPTVSQTQVVRDAMQRSDMRAAAPTTTEPPITPSPRIESRHHFVSSSHRRYSGQSIINTKVDHDDLPSPAATSLRMSSATTVSMTPPNSATATTAKPTQRGTPQQPGGPGTDPEIETYIETLMSKPENERKQKLGSKLFPLIKGLGFKNSTKLTVWILDNMSDDVPSLVYSMNDSIRLQNLVKDAQRTIDSQ
ncbi:hypothetical protein EV182_000668 [Spiromyces aspiralis]|uniref:Uncharacterized protein n=1 Tax=Spiromyces aspiralis TaxID=68401 RepID=A0ACC1HUU5_9FUNG|nr:hypothetical protein EV182_000668 [Spiromyces aspiralis]